MRVAVVDASPIGGGPVSRALACALDELRCEPGDVTRVCLSDLFVTCCASCMECHGSGRCARRSPAIDGPIARLFAADALLLGIAGHAHARDPRSRALLARLVGGFAGVETSRGECGRAGDGRLNKRAALVSSAPPLLAIPAMLGLLPAGLGGAWNILDRAGIDVVACTTVATAWWTPGARDATTDKARRLGRRLGYGQARRPERRAPIPAPGIVPLTARCLPVPPAKTA